MLDANVAQVDAAESENLLKEYHKFKRWNKNQEYFLNLLVLKNLFQSRLLLGNNAFSLEVEQQTVKTSIHFPFNCLINHQSSTSDINKKLLKRFKISHVLYSAYI